MIRRRSVGLLTSFRVEEFGMKGYEPLSWASATLVERFSYGFPRRFHVLANGHVVTPWRYLPLYTPEQVEWLQHVKQEHCRYELQVVSESGEVTYKTEVAKPYAHATRDVASLYLSSEGDVSDILKLVKPAELCGKRICGPEDVLEIAGHSLEGQGDTIMKPLLVEGKLKIRTDKQTFLETAMTLPQGMCGGPAIYKDDSTCAGIIDGIVSPQAHSDADPLKCAVAGAASIVPSIDLRAFLREAESSTQVRNSFDFLVKNDPSLIAGIGEEEDEDDDDDLLDEAPPSPAAGTTGKSAAVPP